MHALHTPSTYRGVMVSSTFLDLIPLREFVFDALQKEGFKPDGMELDSAKTCDIITSSLEKVEASSAYLLVIGSRYGQTPECPTRNPDGISITELEFRKAQKLGLPILLFILGDSFLVPIGSRESDAAHAKLLAFKDTAKKYTQQSPIDRVYAEVATLDEFRDKAIHAIAKLRRDFDAQQQSEPSHHKRYAPSAELAARIRELTDEWYSRPLVGRGSELRALDHFLSRPSGFLLITGNAGQGKSALLAHWLRTLREDRFVLKHVFSCRSDLTRSVLEFYRSTLIALSVHWSQPLHGLPVTENEAREAFFALIESIRGLGTSKDRPVILVIDAIDEASPIDRWDQPFFPKDLPEGIHIIASVRLGDEDHPADYLANWLSQATERLCVPPLNKGAIQDWLQSAYSGDPVFANTEGLVDQLLEKTAGHPLHLAFIIDDLAKSPEGVAKAASIIASTPTGFAPYVEAEFRRLVSSPVGREQKWREFFGLLVAASAELHQEDIESLLSLSVWDLAGIPAELHRWIAEHDGHYAFRNEALRSAFAKIRPWPEAPQRLLDYSKNWRAHRRPYAVRTVVRHLKDAGDTKHWLALAGDQDFLDCQKEVFPHEPLLPLQTIEDAMSGAIGQRDWPSLGRLMIVHAVSIPSPRHIDPLESVKNSSLTRQRIELARLIDPSTEAMWQLVSAWLLTVQGDTAQARQYLSQVCSARHFPMHVMYWSQILGLILPKLSEIDPAQSLEAARQLIHTPELPRLAGLILPPPQAIEMVRQWESDTSPKSPTGWLVFWCSLVEAGHLSYVLQVIKELQPSFRVNILVHLAHWLAQHEQLEDLRTCLVEMEALDSTAPSWRPRPSRSTIIVQALLGGLELKCGNSAGDSALSSARDAATAPVYSPLEQAGLLATIGSSYVRANRPDLAFQVFQQAVGVTYQTQIKAYQKVDALIEIGAAMWPSLRQCPELRVLAEEVVLAMEALAPLQAKKETENGLPRSIAQGWDALGNAEAAWRWVRLIPNPQFRGKAVADLVDARLAADDLDAAHQLIAEHKPQFPGWALVRIGAYHVARNDWEPAAAAFKRAVQGGSTWGGRLKSSPHLVLLFGALAAAFDKIGMHDAAARYGTIALRRAKNNTGPRGLWLLLNLCEETFGMASSDCGRLALDLATKGAFANLGDPERVPLLCRTARVHHLVAQDPRMMWQSFRVARELIENCIREPLRGMEARCEITESMHLLGLHDPAAKLLVGIRDFALSRKVQPELQADRVIAEAALGHVRSGDSEGARFLLGQLGPRRLDSAARASATLHTIDGNDAAAELAISTIGTAQRRTRTRRALAEFLARTHQIDRALKMALRIDVDRDNALPRIARTLIEHNPGEAGHAAFCELVIPGTRFANATILMLCTLLKRHPDLAPEVSASLEKAVPDITSA